MAVYPDRIGRPIHRPLRRRPTPAPADLDDAKTQYILEVAAEHPKFMPEEVLAVIRYGRHRDDITKDMVRHVLETDR